MLDLLKFSHNRNKDFKTSCDELFEHINESVSHEIMGSFYKYFENNYSLPRNIIKHQIRAYLVSNYDQNNCSFEKKFLLRYLFIYLIKYIIFIIIVLMFSKRINNNNRTYKFIIECLIDRDFYMYLKFIDLVGKKNTLILSKKLPKKPGYEFLVKPNYKDFDRGQVIKTCLIEMKYGFILHFYLSIKIGVNLLPIFLHIIKQYLYYYSIFKYNKSTYFLEGRQYQTSAIKNYLFKKFGGKYSCCTQINTVQLGKNGCYFDTDIFFTLGNKSALSAMIYGSRISKIVPVGSLAMQSFYFDNKKSFPTKNNYDIIYITENTNLAFDWINVTNKSVEDYYKTYYWLAKFSNKHPNLTIGIKKHSVSLLDQHENEIIKDTNIKIIDKSLNSYELAFYAKCIVVYGSTMGFELLGHNISVIYMAPGGRNLFINGYGKLLDDHRVNNYQEFEKKLIYNLNNNTSNKSISTEHNYDDFCLVSNKVSERILNWSKLNCRN